MPLATRVQGHRPPVMPTVAEPPKLYGPPVLVIVLKTYDNYIGVPQNLRNLSGILMKPESSMIFRAGSHFRGITVLPGKHHYNQYLESGYNF
jgi:hypothetical protein